MAKTKAPNLDGFQLNASSDMPDSRDWLYRAPPIQLKPEMDCPSGLIILDQMTEGACNGFTNNNAGAETLQAFKPVIENTSKIKLHIVGHSTGAILLAHLLDTLKDQMPGLEVSTCSLLAPAAKVDLFNKVYKPLLNQPKGTFGIKKMAVYNLSKRLEKDDSVGPYRKSLLYFVSRSFEEDTPESILGMWKYSRKIEKAGLTNLEFIYSHGDEDKGKRTLSKTHGGFDNDVATLNDVLKRVLGKKPKHPFRESDLE